MSNARSEFRNKLTLGAALLSAFAFGQSSPDILLFAKARTKMQDHLKNQPNYICLETLERTQRDQSKKRSSLLDVVRLDYVTTARSKGLAESVVINKHVVRNALIPVVTLVALQMPAVFGGAIVTEQIFRIPGIGSLLIDAILRNDTPVIMAVTFVFSTLVIAFNLIADILYGWLDPRISYS